MALKEILTRLGGQLSGGVKAPPTKFDTTPVEVSPRLGMPSVSSLDDMRTAIAILSREKELTGGETFEEFWNFGDDLEFADLEEMASPAQLKAHALAESFTRDFKQEMAQAEQTAKAAARERLKAELRKELSEEDKEIAAKDIPLGGGQAELI